MAEIGQVAVGIAAVVAHHIDYSLVAPDTAVLFRWKLLIRLKNGPLNRTQFKA